MQTVILGHLGQPPQYCSQGCLRAHLGVEVLRLPVLPEEPAQFCLLGVVLTAQMC